MHYVLELQAKMNFLLEVAFVRLFYHSSGQVNVTKWGGLAPDVVSVQRLMSLVDAKGALLLCQSLIPSASLPPLPHCSEMP